VVSQPCSKPREPEIPGSRRHSRSATLLVLLARAAGAIVVTSNPWRSLGNNFEGLWAAENALNLADVLSLIGLDSDDHLYPVLIA